MNKEQRTIYRLFKAKDGKKDQSYFLWQLNQKQLSRILFPIGDYTRKEVENLAKKFKLPFFGVKKSFEICFIPKTIEEFFKKYLKPKPGDIIDKSGKKLGRHQGLWFYTIGQRKGIGFPDGPYFVLGKNLKKNQLIVTKEEKDLYRKDLIAKNVNWTCPPKFSGEKFWRVKAKIRYKAKDVPAKIYILDKNRAKVFFEKPQRAITPGQSVVFYKGEELIGGGIIDRIK